MTNYETINDKVLDHPGAPLKFVGVDERNKRTMTMGHLKELYGRTLADITIETQERDPQGYRAFKKTKISDVPILSEHAPEYIQEAVKEKSRNKSISSKTRNPWSWRNWFGLRNPFGLRTPKYNNTTRSLGKEYIQKLLDLTLANYFSHHGNNPVLKLTATDVYDKRNAAKANAVAPLSEIERTAKYIAKCTEENMKYFAEAKKILEKPIATNTLENKVQENPAPQTEAPAPQADQTPAEAAYAAEGGKEEDGVMVIPEDPNADETQELPPLLAQKKQEEDSGYESLDFNTEPDVDNDLKNLGDDDEEITPQNFDQ